MLAGMDITYRLGNDLDLDAVIAVYAGCSLGARRPIADRERMATMLANANLVVSAWDGERLVGIARSVSDFAFCTYLSDLAVHDDHQRHGIGRALIHHTRAAAPQTNLILLSAPQAVDYYPRLGFTRHESAWMVAAGVPLAGATTS